MKDVKAQYKVVVSRRDAIKYFEEFYTNFDSQKAVKLLEKN